MKNRAFTKALEIETRYQQLERENAELKLRNASLEAKLDLQAKEIAQLKSKVEQLMRLLEQKTIPKDSHNSHNPPSQDKGRPKRNQSRRKTTGKKSGGQLGHKGYTLKMRENPKEIVTLQSDYCSKCGEDLEGLEQKLISKRQVLELPPIELNCIEYQQMGCNCPCCLHLQKAEYPKNVTAPIQYGSGVIALIVYMNVFQYIPYGRMKNFFKDIFNHSISEGTINNLLVKAGNKAKFVYAEILEEIKRSFYVGGDETGIKVNGNKWWIWVWQNVKNTYLIASENRGFQTIQDLLSQGLPNTIVGSDRWAAQLKTQTKGKQICIAHLLRDLVYLIELEKTQWAQQFKTLLLKALKIREECVENQTPLQAIDQKAKDLEQQMDDLLLEFIDKQKHSKSLTFQKSMLKHRPYLFTFLYYLEVPPDNNGSERAIRMAKVKLKISGMFKSGQHTFCILRSVCDTLRKRNLNMHSVMMQIIQS
jgi:transposase